MAMVDYKNKNMAGLLSKFGNSLFFQEKTDLVLINCVGSVKSVATQSRVSGFKFFNKSERNVLFL
jgi:hypothetical protein